MKQVVFYIHGKGGNAQEAFHYQKLFPHHEVIGLDYHAQTPWEAQEELRGLFHRYMQNDTNVTLVANSIGAYFALHAFASEKIAKAYFISPIVDMEELIGHMMEWTHVTEKDLQRLGVISTSFGEDLSWSYLTWVRNHPVFWPHPTALLYGAKDLMQTETAMKTFANRNHAHLTIWPEGEHWFHTEEQMAFLDNWIDSQEGR